MAISGRLKGYLDSLKVRYTTATHPVVYTAQEIAAALHVPGRQLAKNVLVKTDHGPVLAVLPAMYLIDFKKLKALLHAKTVTIGKESDIKALFPDVEVGAMSPFGNLYQVPVVVDRTLEAQEQITFNAGTHTQTVTMRFRDFAAAVNSKLGFFAQVTGRQKAKPAAKKKKASKPSRAKRATRKPARNAKTRRR